MIRSFATRRADAKHAVLGRITILADGLVRKSGVELHPTAKAQQD